MKFLLNSESFKKGFIVSSFLNFIAKTIAFFSTVAIAYYFGTNEKTDVYFFCFSIISTFSAFLISLSSTIIIPEAMQIRESAGEKASQHFLTFFLFIYLLICVSVSLCSVFNPLGIFCALSKFTPQILGDNILILYFSIPLLILITVNSFLTDILVSHKYFSVSVLSTLLNSVFSILFVLAFHEKLQILSVVFGVLIANVLQLFINVYLLKKRVHWSFKFVVIKLKRKTVHDIIIAQAGNLTTMATNYVPVLLISKYQSGILSTINYGSRVSEVITLLITIQFGSVVGIKFNELYAQKNTNEIRSTFINGSAFLQFILIPICFFIFIYSQDIIRVLFGHGAFGKTSISNSAMFLKLFILILPFTAHNTMVARLFMAAQKINKAYIFQIIMSFVMIFIIYAFITTLGPIGYPLGSFIFYILNSIAAIIIMRKNFLFIPYEQTLLYTVKCCLINIPILIIILGLNRITGSRSILYLGTAFVLYLIALLGLNQKMKLNETVSNAVKTGMGRVSVLMRKE